MMLHHKQHNLRKPRMGASVPLKLFLTATAAALLAGCQSVQLPSFKTDIGTGPEMAPAQLPQLALGDKYYYSNGALEQVVSTQGEMVNMINKSKRKLTNFRNFVLPQPYIEGSTKEYFKNTPVPTNLMWPLSVGTSERFSSQGRTVTKLSGRTSKYTQRWTCETTGTAHVRVLAGEFDTYVVECKRYSSRGKWWQNRTWHYAPILGTYVLRRDYYKKSGERLRELTALRPSLKGEPKHVRQGIIHAWQVALENKKAGEIQSWTDTASGTSVQVEPLKTYRAKNNQFCRTYKQYLTRSNVTRIYMGVACRTGKLKWRTPRRG